MSTFKVSCAQMSVPGAWRDITADLPLGTPPTLAKGEEGLGAFQISVAKYKSSQPPIIELNALADMLSRFAHDRQLGDGSAPRVMKTVLGVSRDFASDGDFCRVWLISNRRDVVFATYTVAAVRGRDFSDELSEAESIAESVRFAVERTKGARLDI